MVRVASTLGVMTSIAFFGLGAMGSAMAARLVDAGLHGRADALLHGAERAERHADPDDVREQHHGSAPAELVDAGQ